MSSKDALPAMLVLVLTLLTGYGRATLPPDTSTGIVALSIGLDEHRKEASVSEKVQGNVSFTGTVTVDKPPVMRVVVSLACAIDTSWALECTPSTMVVIGASPQEFTVTVVVPEATAADIVGNLTITASSSGTGYSAQDTANATVTIAPYFGLRLESERPFIDVRPNAGTDFNVRVRNEGNAADSFELEVANANELSNKGWRAVLGQTALSNVPSRGSAEFTVSVSPTSEKSAFETTTIVVNMKATSVGARNHGLVVTQSFPLYIHQKGEDVVGLGIDIAIIAVIVAAVSVLAWRWRRKKRAAAAAAPVPLEAADNEKNPD